MNLSYSLSGNPTGPKVLFLHGFMGTRQDWIQVIGELSDSFYCYAIDLPGHGETQFIPKADFYIMLLYFIEKHQIEHVVGYSMGGRIIAEALLSRSIKLKSLVLESAHPGLAPEAKGKRILSDSVLLSDISSEESLQNFLQNWYRAPMWGGILTHSNSKSLFNFKHYTNVEGWQHALEEYGTGRQIEFFKELHSLANRVAYWAGSLDDRYCALSMKVASSSPDVSIQKFQSCGHNIHFQSYKEYAKELLSFIGRSS